MDEASLSASPLPVAAEASFQLKLTGFPHNHTVEQVNEHIVEAFGLNSSGSTCVSGAPKGYCKLFFRNQEDLSSAELLLNSLQTPVLGAKRVTAKSPACSSCASSGSATPLPVAAEASFQLKLTGFPHNHTVEQVNEHIVEAFGLNSSGSTCVSGAPKGYCKLFFRNQEDLSSAELLLNSLQTPVLGAKKVTAKCPGQQSSARELRLDSYFGNVLLVVNPLLLWSFQRNRKRLHDIFHQHLTVPCACALQNTTFGSPLGTMNDHNNGKRHRHKFLTHGALCVTLAVRLSSAQTDHTFKHRLRRAISILSQRHQLLQPPQKTFCMSTLVRYPFPYKDNESSFAFHPRLAMVATGFFYDRGEYGDRGFDDGTVTLWQLKPDTFRSGPIRALHGHKSFCVKSAAFHPFLPLLATGAGDCVAKLWRLFPGSVWAACRSTLCGHTGAVCSMVFHPRLPLLATGSTDGAAKLWQFNSDYTCATCVCTLQGHSGAVLSVVFHARLPLLVAGNAGKCVKVWNLNGDGTHAVCVATLHDHAEEHGSVDFHPVLPLFATGGRGGALTMWQLNRDCTSIHCVAVINAHSHVCSVGFHARLPLLATGSAR